MKNLLLTKQPNLSTIFFSSAFNDALLNYEMTRHESWQSTSAPKPWKKTDYLWSADGPTLFVLRFIDPILSRSLGWFMDNFRTRNNQFEYQKAFPGKGTIFYFKYSTKADLFCDKTLFLNINLNGKSWTVEVQLLNWWLKTSKLRCQFILDWLIQAVSNQTNVSRQIESCYWIYSFKYVNWVKIKPWPWVSNNRMLANLT